MTVYHKQPCPCGSGKRYKHCCLGKDVARRRSRFILTLGLGAGIVGALTFYAYSASRKATEAPTTQTVTIPTSPNATTQTVTTTKGGGDVQVKPGVPLAPGEHPAPYEYDAARDLHYDPAHGHWHHGRPPANPTPTSQPNVTVTQVKPTPGAAAGTSTPSAKAASPPAQSPP